MKKQALILLLAGVLFMTGCGGKGNSQTAAYSPYKEEMAEETIAAAVDTAALPADGTWDEEGQTSSGLSSSLELQPPAASARKLIRNVFMNVETDAFDTLISQIQSKVTELGGYMEQSDISGSSITHNNIRPDRYGSITARIPADKLDSFIALVEDSGNVTNRSESTQDVTLQYSDLESRKKTLAMEQERIWALLEKADTLEAVIALEEHLSQIRYELESMESRLKLYDNQVAYSTIQISVHEVLPVDFTPVVPETVPQRIQKGFVKNAKNVAEFLTDLFVGLITGIPVWLPLLAGLALFRIIAKRAFRKNRSFLSLRIFRKKTAKESSPQDSANDQ